MADTTVTKTFSSASSSSSLPVPAGALYSLLITGTFVATLIVEASDDGGLNWRPIGSYTAALAVKNFVLPQASSRSLLRVRCSSYTSGSPVVTLTLPEAVLFEIDNAGGAAVLRALASGVQSPNVIGTPTGLAAYDPGQIAVNSLRVASDVVSAETVTIGADVYEVEIVNTDSTDTTAGGDFNNTSAVISILAATYSHLSTTLGTLIRVEDEIMRLTATGTYLTYTRGASGTTIAAHANATAIYKGDGVVAGRIAVGLVTTLTPTAFTAALLADINAVGTELVTAVLISVNEILLKARSVGAVVLATTETLAGANNAWAATAMYGGKAQGVRKFNFQSRVPKALDVTLGTMKFQFDFTPTLVQVYIVVTATPGVALAWDGGVTISEGLVTIDNTGSTDWAATSTVYVYAQG